MKKNLLFLFGFSLFLITNSQAGEVASYDYNNENLLLPIPNGFCNATEDLVGVFTMDYMNRQLSQGLDAHAPVIVFTRCGFEDDIDEMYPWGYIALAENSKPRLTQESVNKMLSTFLDSSEMMQKLQEINDKEKRDILATRNQLKVEKDQQVNDLKKEISEINEDLLNQKKQRDNLIQKSSVTTLGNKRVALLNTKTSEAQKTSSSYMEDEKKLSKQIMEKETDLANFLGIFEEQLSPMENDKAMQINTIRERTRQAIQTEEDIKNKNINDFNGREYRIGEISERTLDLKKSVDVDEAKIMEEGRNTLVGSWTIFFFKDMEPDNLRLVTMIWYGSLAAITAWTGTLLAFASLVLRYSHEKKNDPSRLMRPIQKYFIYARKNKRKPRIKEVEKEVEKIVEVIKEVPVTKVVTQEVPKEVIRKQIIHVPVATDDLTILDFNDRRSNKSEKDNPNTANEGTSNSKT